MPMDKVMSATENPKYVLSQVLSSKASWKAPGLHNLPSPPREKRAPLAQGSTTASSKETTRARRSVPPEYQLF